MKTDPIVKESRKAGAELASEAGGDIHVFFENLRKAQSGYGNRLTRTVRREQKSLKEEAS
jgi:hypothetical protein